MNQVVQLSQEQFEALLKRLSRLESLMAKFLEKEDFPEGSDKWWELSDKEALEDIKKGHYTVVNDKKALQSHLDSLKKS